MLYFEQSGEGPNLLFVHGMCGDAEVWHDQVQRLHDRFRCTSYDRRGHSRSPQTDPPETIESHADDAAHLIDDLGLGPVVLVGSSGGARISVDVIRRYPHLVRGAVLSEPPIAGLAPDAFPAMIADVAPKVQHAAETEGPRAAVDAFFSVLCPGLWAAVSEKTKDRYRDNAPMLFADLGSPTYQVDETAIGAIDVPVLVVAGTTSHPALRTGAANLARWLPDARFLELDCGHVTYAEQPEAFAAAVAAFATELMSTEPAG